MKKNNQTLEVLEPEVEEIPLEEVINTTLVKANVTDAVIASLKEKYGGLKLASLDDKESYLNIKEARKEVRKVGIITEKLCKKGREYAVAIQKKWLAKEKEILGKIDEVEIPLNNEIEKFDKEVERKELEAAKQREEVFINRQSALSKMGAVYNNGSFELNHISYELELLKSADNDMWNDTILPKYKKEFEANEAVKVAEENKRKEEMEKAKKEREEFEEKQAKFKRQQDLFAQQQKELQKMKDDAEREQRLAQEKKEAKEKEMKQAVIDARVNQLRHFGMTFNHTNGSYDYQDIRVIIGAEVELYSDDEWKAMVEKILPDIQQRQKEVAEKLAIEQEKKRQQDIEDALQKEREKVAEEKRQSEIKQHQEEQRKQEELAKSGDKAKWQHLIGQLSAIQLPPMSSGMYRIKLAQAKEKIEEIQNL